MKFLPENNQNLPGKVDIFRQFSWKNRNFSEKSNFFYRKIQMKLSERHRGKIQIHELFHPLVELSKLGVQLNLR